MRFGTNPASKPAIHVTGRREPVDGGQSVRHLGRQIRPGGQCVEPPDRPRVSIVDVAHEAHHLGVVGDVPPAFRALDGLAYRRCAPECDETGLDKRKRHVLVVGLCGRPASMRQQPLAPVLGSLTAMLAHQAFDPHLVEAAAGNDERMLGVIIGHANTGDDRIDIVFDVDPGLCFEITRLVVIGA